MVIKPLVAGLKFPGLLILLCCSVVSRGGGFDNSGLPFDIIFDSQQKVNEWRLSFARVRPSIDGSIQPTRQSGSSAIAVRQLVPDYSDRHWALRYRLTDYLTCALRYEEPYRADVQYADDSLSYLDDASRPAAAPVSSVYQSELLTTACRVFWRRGNHVWSLISGIRHQKVRGAFSSDLGPGNQGASDNLDVRLNGGSEVGQLWGVSWAYPSVAARVTVFYRDAIHYSLTGETLTPVSMGSPRMRAPANAETLTPQTVVLSWQTGIAENWLLFGSFRWSEWRKVDAINVSDGVGNPSLSLYRNNTLDYNLGMIHQFSQRWKAGFSYASGKKLGGTSGVPGYDSENLRDPQGRRHIVATGLQHSPRSDLAVDLLMRYAYLEEKRVLTNSFEARFPSNQAFSLELGFSWFFQ